MSIQRATFGGFRQLGITEEDAQREIYSRVTGQSRLSLMTPTEVEDFIVETLTAVPDETAKKYAHKLTLYSESARNEIATKTAKALDDKRRWTYEPSATLKLKRMFGGAPW